MTRPFLFAALLIGLAGCGSGTNEGEATDALTSAAELSDAMLASFEGNVGAVEGFTVRAEGAEGRYTLLGDTASMDRLALEVAPASGMGRPNPSTQLHYSHIPNILRIASGLRTATFEGRSMRDGRAAYVLSTDDPTAMLGEGGAPPMDGDRVLRVYVDPETFDILEIYQSFDADSSAFTSRLVYSDFQTADGLRLARKVVQIATGLNQGVSEGQRIRRGAELGLALNQAEQMPQGPERDAAVARLQAEMRTITEGTQELTFDVESVTVGVPDPVQPFGAGGAPPPAAP